MAGRRVWRVSALVAFAFLAAAPEVRAQKVAVTEFYGEADVRDEAGAVTLLVRSMLSGDRVQVVARADLEAAFARAQAQRSGSVRRLSLEQLRDLLVSTGASAVITGEVVRAGPELRATALVLRSGSAIHILTASAGDGNVAALAEGLSQGLAGDLKSAARPRPNTSLGRLRAFVAADAALRTGEPARALELLRTADPQASGRAPAAREVPAAIVADGAQPVAARIDAALLATEPDRALELASAALKASRADRVGALGAARAHLSRMNVQAAAGALAPLEKSTDPAVLAARAEMAHYADDRALRDQLLGRLMVAAPAAALPVVDLVAPGGLPAELEEKALAAAEALEPSWLRSALGIRAAAGKVGGARGLALVQVSDLDDGDLALARTAAAEAGGQPEGLRLRAQLALFDADYTAARTAVTAWLAAAPDDARAHLELGRLLVREGKPADGAVELGRAAAGGIRSAGREQAMALFIAGDVAAANAILTKLDDEASVLALVTGALARLEDGDVTGARGDLERALSLSVANPDLLRALMRLERERGGTPMSSDIKLLADKLAAGPPKAKTEAHADPLQESAKARSGGGGADGKLDGILDRMLSGLPVPTGARRVLVVPLAGEGLPFYHWYRAEPERVDASLHRVLEQNGLSATDASAAESEPLAAGHLEGLARKAKADAVLLYRVRAGGRQVEATLSLFVPGTAALAHVSEKFDGRATGVIGWNRLFLIAIGLLVAGLVAYLVRIVRRGSGALHVTFKSLPGASDEVFAIRLTRSGKRPAFDLADFRSEMARAGHKIGRLSATMVGGTTSFPRVPAGRWHAHLLGAYTIAGETRVLDEKQTQAVQVIRKAPTSINFDLGSSKAELLIRVYNPGGAASGILVGVDDHNRARTDAQGEARLQVDPGDYTLTIEAEDMSLSQLVSVAAPTTQRVAIHLDRERRRAEVAGDMSIPQDAGELVIERHETEKVPRMNRRMGSSQNVGPPGVLMSAGSLAIGDTIGKYHLSAELGRGAMGLVYRARDTKLERDVALKVISDELRSHPVAMQLFIDEAKALAQLNHPNIVGVYDQNEEMGVTYMVMELVEGQTLEDILLQRGRLGVSEALEIIDQLCAGLAYAHERKVIHRDIKPANIFLTEDRIVKLGDFGLARVMREIAIRRTEIRGTPLYMAPEQVTGTDIDRRADLYAVGCTLFEMLTGAPPFTDGDIMFQQLHTAPPRPSSKVGGLPPALDALVLSCLEKDRRARIDSATLIRERLKAVRP